MQMSRPPASHDEIARDRDRGVRTRKRLLITSRHGQLDEGIRADTTYSVRRFDRRSRRRIAAGNASQCRTAVG